MINNIKDKLLPQTLFGRSLMIIALPILILQMVVAIIFFDRHWDSTINKAIFALSGEIEMIAKDLSGQNDARQEAIIKRAFKALDLKITLIPVTDDLFHEYKGKLGPFYRFSLTRKLKKELERKIGEPFSIKPDSREDWLQIVVPLDKESAAIFVVPERRLTGSTTYIFLLWVIGSAAILFSIAILFMRNQIRPIMRLAIAAEKLGKGQEVPDFKAVGAYEVRRASGAFLLMKDRLKRQIEQRTAMLSGVSHDLRTPLTRMKLQVEFLKDLPDVQALREDIDEMEKMIDGYLSFAKGDTSEPSENIDIRSLVSTIVAKFRRQNFTLLDSYGDDKIILKVKPLASERALSNIIMNACKYAKSVWVDVTSRQKDIVITIDDDEPGIPPALFEDVFKPFYRIEKSRNKNTGGVGLGLSIALDVIHAHGGDIKLDKSPRGGLRVLITIPA